MVTEALARGRHVTAVVRDPARGHALPGAAEGRAGDAAHVEGVAESSSGQDVVISATRPAPGREQELVTTTVALPAGLGPSGRPPATPGAGALGGVAGAGSQAAY